MKAGFDQGVKWMQVGISRTCVDQQLNIYEVRHKYGQVKRHPERWHHSSETQAKVA